MTPTPPQQAQTGQGDSNPMSEGPVDLNALAEEARELVKEEWRMHHAARAAEQAAKEARRAASEASEKAHAAERALSDAMHELTRTGAEDEALSPDHPDPGGNR